MATLDDIRQLFFAECEDQLEQLTDGLATLEALPPGETPDPETINTMFRAVHSIKGGAASFALDAITRYAHAFESVLDEVRTGTLPIDAGLTAAFYVAADYLSELVAMGMGGGTPETAALAERIAAIEACSAARAPHAPPAEDDLPSGGLDMLAGFTPLALDFDFGPPEVPGAAADGFVVTFRPTAALFQNGHEPTCLFRELEPLGTLEVEALLDEGVDWDRAAPGIGWRLTLRTGCDESQIREIFEFAEPFAELSIAPLATQEGDEPKPLAALPAPIGTPDCAPDPAPPDPAPPEPSPPEPSPEAERAKAPKATVRVDLELVDDLINMVGELVITQSVMTQSIADHGLAGSTQLSAVLEELRGITRHIQEGVMAIRAQSVKPLFQRMGRIVRETAQIAGKTVRLATVGEDTEVDRNVIERLVDPLTHILRNAIDHGLEDAAGRLAADKDPVGTVTLTAAHRSGRVVIEVSDDGAGVDRAKVLASAIRKGLVPANATPGPAEIDRLLFTPGFSTAASVTSLSGRGVGMDVVNSEIKRLGGRVTIASTPGRGATISISLPLTLAVLDGMVVEVAGQTMVVPISAIVETILPEPSQLSVMAPGMPMLTVRGRAIPVIDLAGIFGFARPVDSRPDGVLMLVETDDGDCCALAIDRIVDQRQVVIKSLESNYGHVPFISAATILGDGRIALILDLEETLHHKASPSAPAVPQPLEVPA